MNRKGQRGRVLQVLVDARYNWVPLSKILQLNIAQFGARILELRRMGFAIENKTESVSGVRHSWYRLRPGQRLPEPKQQPQEPASLFGDLSPEPKYPD